MIDSDQSTWYFDKSSSNLNFKILTTLSYSLEAVLKKDIQCQLKIREQCVCQQTILYPTPLLQTFDVKYTDSINQRVNKYSLTSGISSMS